MNREIRLEPDPVQMVRNLESPRVKKKKSGFLGILIGLHLLAPGKFLLLLDYSYKISAFAQNLYAGQ